MSDKQLTTIQKESVQLVEQARSVEIKNQLSYDTAATFLKTCLNLKKKIELFFEPNISNFKKAKKAAEDGRKAEVDRMEVFLSPVKEAILMVQRKAKDFENEQEKIRLAEQARLDAEAKEKEAVAKEWEDDTPVEVEKAKPTIAKTAGLGISRRWKAKVVDKSKIPLEYLEVNLPALNKKAGELHEKFDIPGAEAIYD